MHEIAASVATDPLQVESVAETLVGMDWVARLDEEGGQRLVLLADPATTSARPLIDALLLSPAPAARQLRERFAVERLTLADLI